MQPSEALGIAAQVAVTLAGFAGVVVVFRPESVHQWSPLDRFRLHLLLANSALPLVSSLFGIWLLAIDPAPEAIWRWCSGFALLLQVPFILSTSARGRRIPRADQAPVNKPLYYSLALLGTVALVLQVINVVAWNRFWPFFFIIFVSLGAAVAQFVRFVILPPHTE
ncbi:MAG: hypothetical protein ACREIW_02550 [Chthoniobacterales bacterium]